MKLTQLDGLLAFATVAERGNFTAAAAQLEVTPSAVSQTVRQLEERLGVRLLHRTTRSVRLTEAGEQFLARVAPAVAELAQAAAELDEYRGGASGVLRLNMAHIAYAACLRPLLPGFLARYPAIKLELDLDDGFVDIVAGGFDAGVRLGESVQLDMVTVPLTRQERMCMVASPDYAARCGLPCSVEELRRHDCIRFRFRKSQAVYRWEVLRDGQLIEVEVGGRGTGRHRHRLCLRPAGRGGPGGRPAGARVAGLLADVHGLSPVLPDAPANARQAAGIHRLLHRVGLALRAHA
jgi:DNA-binding transcriptional LysR family regulator